MDKFIMGMVMFLILVFFPMQIVLNEVNHHKMRTVDRIVYWEAQEARMQGYFTNDSINDIKQKIADALYIDPSEVQVEATMTPKYRRNEFNEVEMIEYEVSIPIKKLVVMGSFYGIDPSNNQMDYIVSGKVPSEVLAP